MTMKRAASEFIGKTYNNLTILEDLGNPNGNDRTVLAKCICGSIREYVLLNIKKGQSKSCGCIRKPKKNAGLKEHPLYWIRSGMMDRCYNKNSAAYPYYGERGVVVCEEWINQPRAFIEWGISNGWKPGLEIDKDIMAKELGVEPLLYSPERCMFVSEKENSNSRRSNKYLTYNGQTKTIAEWRDVTGIGHVIYYRLRSGWSVEKALTTPVKKVPL